VNDTEEHPMTIRIRQPEGYDADEYGIPAGTQPRGIRCGHHPHSLGIRHENAAAIRACGEVGRQLAAESAAEIYAEAVMSWVAGGGSPADAGRYAAVIAMGGTWDGGIGHEEFSGELCGHGLALELCCGPQHYPMDV
jgi:hypothetical protein